MAGHLAEVASPLQPNSSLWLQWVHCYLLRTDSIWGVQHKQTDSYTWKHLLQLRDDLRLRNGGQCMDTSWGLDAKEWQKQAYSCLHRANAPVEWHSWVWSKNVPPKGSFLAWKVVSNRVWTMDRVLKFHPTVSPVCCLCHEANESRNHLFF